MFNRSEKKAPDGTSQDPKLNNISLRQPMSRRTMIASLCCIGEAGVLTTPAVFNPLRTPTNIDTTTKAERIKEELKGEQDRPQSHILTDKRLTLPHGSKVRVIGVRHLEANKLENDAVLMQAIREADVIFVETEVAVNQIAPTHFSEGYFADLRRAVLSQDKKEELIDFDAKSGFFAMAANWTTTSVAAFAGLGVLTGAVPALRRSFMPTRAFLRVLGYSAAMLSFPSPQMTAAALTGSGYPLHDASFCLDGRTVFMWDGLLTRDAQRQPFNGLTITGDMHALGFLEYDKDPDIFAKKLKMYRTVYDKLLGITQPPERLILESKK